MTYKIVERKNERTKTHRVWDLYAGNDYAVLEIIADANGLHVFDGEGVKLGFIPNGEVRAST